MRDARRRVVIEHVTPEIDAGRFPVKRVPGDRVAYLAEYLEGVYTTGPIAALQAAIRSGRLGEARTTLMLAAGAGVTIALALYRQKPAMTRAT